MTSTIARRLLSGPRRQLLAAAVVGIIASALAAGAAAGVVLTRDAIYESQALLVIDQPQVLAASGDAGVIVKLNALRLKYAALAETSVIAVPVAQELGIPEGSVRAQTSAEATFDALVMRTVARTGSADGARILAQAVAERLVQFVAEEQAALPIAGNERIELRIVEDAFPGVQVEPDELRAVFVSLASAVLAFGVAFVSAVAVLQRRSGDDER